jgi:hypothetical protein
MKEIKYILSLLIIAGTIFYSSCGGGGDDNPLSEQQKAARALQNGSPWTVDEITNDPRGTVDGELANLSLVFGTGEDFAPGTFTAAGAPNYISSVGTSTWNWAGSGTGTITLTDASIDQFTGVTYSPGVDNATQITVTFNISDSKGKVSGLIGNYTVVFSASGQ